MPHYFRHNYSSILYRSGVDVLTAQQYLGHAAPATTMRIYTHLADETHLKDAEKIRKAFR
jgi:integrase